jgi:FlaA1/EpsC-like NDP-sugar epimerase
MILGNKTLLITDGTGFFGNDVLRHHLDTDIKGIFLSR